MVHRKTLHGVTIRTCLPCGAQYISREISAEVSKSTPTFLQMRLREASWLRRKDIRLFTVPRDKRGNIAEAFLNDLGEFSVLKAAF